MTDHRHDETIAVLRHEMTFLTSDNEQERASAISTIQQQMHLAEIADPMATETVAKLTRFNGRLADRYREEGP